MLEDWEKDAVSSLLDSLTQEELTNILGTVTKNLLKNQPSNNRDVIKAIIQHSSDCNSILKRRAITNSVLYSYLHEHGVKVSSPITKGDLISATLSYWKHRYKSNGKNKCDKHGESTGHENPKTECVTDISIKEESQNNERLEESLKQEHERLQRECAQLDKYEQTQDPNSSGHINIFNSNDRQDVAVNFPVNVMARTFAEWFYKLYNEANGLTANHFWPDSSLRIHIKSAENVTTQQVLNNAEEVVTLLEQTKSAHGLYFNPNISHVGTQGRMDVHGLILIVACGTLHKENLCVGVFEQMFALARDPQAQNNWKIRNVEFKLRSQSVNSVPSILESDYRNDILALPINDEDI